MSTPSSPPYEDADQRLGGADNPHETMLESLHEVAEKVPTKKTRYEVSVRSEESPPSWTPVRTVEATSARDAIRLAADGGEPVIAAGDVLRAVPTRNITQLRLDVETTTKLRLS